MRDPGGPISVIPESRNPGGDVKHSFFCSILVFSTVMFSFPSRVLLCSKHVVTGSLWAISWFTIQK